MGFPSLPCGDLAPSVGTRGGIIPGSCASQSEMLKRKIVGILNRLTEEKFNKLSNDILNLDIPHGESCKMLCFLIFEKAAKEPMYSSLYARLCALIIYRNKPNNAVQAVYFQMSINMTCNVEHKNRLSNLIVENDELNPLTEKEMEEKRWKAKRRVLGAIKFFGELVLTEVLRDFAAVGYYHEYVRGFVCNDRTEELENLCQFMKIVGKYLESREFRERIDEPLMLSVAQLFENLEEILSTKLQLPVRIRYMLQDLIDLRNNDWKPRNVDTLYERH